MSSWGDREGAALPAAFRAVGSSSFIELISQVMPHTLARLQDSDLTGSSLTTPNLTAATLGAQSLAAQSLAAQSLAALAASELAQIPHGTTVVAAICRGGVVMAGDRRATMGNLISQRDIEKVFPADQHCCVGIAGAAGIAVELVRLFQVELEHYEKIEGTQLSLDGKANRLSALLRANLGLALRGLAALPILAGYDLDARRGRIFGYDVTGGRNEESAFHCIGSGSMFARGALKKLYVADLEPHRAAAVAIEALYDAADDDSATGGPDLSRHIFPSVAIVDCDGFRRLAEEEVSQLATEMVARRGQRPDGPLARLD